jgi:urease accessory protein
LGFRNKTTLAGYKTFVGTRQSISIEAIPKREWSAQLQLQFSPSAVRTELVRAKHIGPLRVQRPFYPEGECCHLYILHPPGGIVPGDTLTLDAKLENGAQVLLTTPSAGKIYGSDAQLSGQSQGISAVLERGSCLEWLPQETIVFSGAEVKLSNRFQLADNANLIAWDIVCLGRRSSGEQFAAGNCRQHIDVWRGQQLLMRERCHWQGGSDMLNADWGMSGNVVSGTFFATLESTRQQMDDWREALTQLNLSGEWGLSQKPGIFIARYLGMSAEQCRRGFEILWSRVRPVVKQKEICRPRIWNT